MFIQENTRYKVCGLSKWNFVFDMYGSVDFEDNSGVSLLSFDGRPGVTVNTASGASVEDYMLSDPSVSVCESS